MWCGKLATVSNGETLQQNTTCCPCFLFINLHSISSSAESALPSSQDGCPTLAWGSRSRSLLALRATRGLQLPACPARVRDRRWAGPGTATPVGSRAGRSGGAELRWRDKSSRMWRSWGEGVGGRWTRWRRGPPPPSPTRGGDPRGAGRRSYSATPAAARAEGWRSPRTWRPSSWPGAAARASPWRTLSTWRGSRSLAGSCVRPWTRGSSRGAHVREWAARPGRGSRGGAGPPEGPGPRGSGPRKGCTRSGVPGPRPPAGEAGLQFLPCSVTANSHELGTVPAPALENDTRKRGDFLFSKVCAAQVDLTG